MSTAINRLLIIDDDESFRQLIKRLLENILPEVELEEYDPLIKDPPSTEFSWDRYDLVILDYYLGGTVTGLDVLNACKKLDGFPAAIMLTAAGNEEIAVRAMKSGIHDYLRKETITEDRLRKSIFDAIESYRREKEARADAAQSNQSFDKILFYKELENVMTAPQQNRDRVLLIIELDGYEALGEERGLIIQDNIVRHIAKNAYEVFQEPGYRTMLTRFSDASVAVLIENKNSRDELVAAVENLCRHYDSAPYEYAGEKTGFNVSIGIIPLRGISENATGVIKHAREACRIAAREETNSFHILGDKIYAEPGPPAVESIHEPAAPAIPESQEVAEHPFERTSDITIIPPPEPAEITSFDEQEMSRQKEEEERMSKQVAEDLAEWAEERGAETKKTNADVAHSDHLKRIKERADARRKQAKKATDDLVSDIADQLGSEEDEPQFARPEKPFPQIKQIIPAATVANTQVTVSMQPSLETGEDVHKVELGVVDNDFLKAINENRVLQYFQPMIPFSEVASQDLTQIYLTLVRIIGMDGTVLNSTQTVAELKKEGNEKLIDRWMLRETIGRQIEGMRLGRSKYVFVITISEESLTDADLFHWLHEKLMKHVEQHNPARSIVLKINFRAFISRKRQAEALITYFGKSYGFRFALSGIDDPAVILPFTKKTHFDYIIMNHQLVNANARHILDQLRQAGSLIVAAFIEDAMTLTKVINAGADYAIGYFTGEPLGRLDDRSRVESFEIS